MKRGVHDIADLIRCLAEKETELMDDPNGQLQPRVSLILALAWLEQIRKEAKRDAGAGYSASKEIEFARIAAGEAADSVVHQGFKGEAFVQKGPNGKQFVATQDLLVGARPIWWHYMMAAREVKV